MTSFSSIADLEGLPSGAWVTVQRKGQQAASYQRVEGGLAKDGAVVPFRLFTGLLSEGAVSPGELPLPEAGAWYTSTTWTFYVLSVQDGQVTYVLWSRGTLNRIVRTVPIMSWNRNPKVRVQPAEVPIGNALMVARLCDEFHHQYQTRERLAADLRSTEALLLQRPTLEAIAARLNDSELDRMLTRMGWGRAHETVVDLTITGQVLVHHRDMKRVIKGVTGVTWGDVNVPFTVQKPITQHVGEGGCACANNTAELRRTAAEFVPEGATTWRVQATCHNH